MFCQFRASYLMLIRRLFAQNLPITKIVDHLMEFKNSQEMDEYHYFDPKQLKLTEIPKNRSPFQDAYVFIVGGGNYIEYQNLVDYAKVTYYLTFIKFCEHSICSIFQAKTTAGQVRRITYGTTTLNNASQFLQQLALLGQEL